MHDDFKLTDAAGHELSWSQCDDCGFTFMNPKLSQTEMRKVYDSDVYWNEGSYRDYIENEPIRVANSELRLKSLSRFLPRKGTLLDVGCATGFFASAAHRFGFDVVGIDPAARMIEFGKKTYGIDLRAETIEEASFPEGNFDVISLWGTDSHFYDPRESFSRIVAWLKPGGLFLFNYQDYGSPIRRLFPKIKQTANVYYNFTRPSFRTFSEQLGLSVLLDKTDVQLTQVHRITRTLNLRFGPLVALDNFRIKIPTISYRIVVAKRRLK